VYHGAVITVVFAHPYPTRSRANQALLRGIAGLDGVAVRSLYDLYPAFDIDVEAEQRALVESRAIVWQHPLYWYSVPGLLKHWFDKVLERGFGYGEGGTALANKACLWVATTGGDDQAFSTQGMHAHPFSAFVPVVEQTARFCGMQWLEPLIVHGAHKLREAELVAHGEVYRARLEGLLKGEGAS